MKAGSGEGGADVCIKKVAAAEALAVLARGKDENTGRRRMLLTPNVEFYMVKAGLIEPSLKVKVCDSLAC
jgi:hypothetical protein